MGQAVNDLPPGFVVDNQSGLPAGFVVDQPSAPSISQRIGADVQNRMDIGKQIIGNVQSGQTHPLDAAVQYTGKVGAGLASDVIGEVIPQPVKNLASVVGGAIEKVGSLVPGAQDYADTANTAWQTIQQKHPDAAKTIEAVGDVANLGGTIAAPESIITPARAAMNASSDYLANRIAAAPKAPITKAAAERAASSALYDQAKSDNIQFDQQTLNTLRSKLSALTPATDAERRVWNTGDASGVVKGLQDSMDTEPLTFNGALAQRSNINSLARKAARAGDDAEKERLLSVKETLDRAMTNDKTGTWQVANHQWAKAATLQDIEDMVKSAKGKAQPANSLGTSIDNYLNSHRSMGLSDAERLALENVSKRTWGGELLKTTASRLSAHVGAGVGSAIGGIPGAVAGHLVGTYGSMFARDAAMSSKLAKLDEVSRIIQSRKPPASATPKLTDIIR